MQQTRRPATSCSSYRRTRPPAGSLAALAGRWLGPAWLMAIAAMTVAALLPAFAPPGANHADKWSHFVAYAVLGVLGMAAFPGRLRLVVAVLVADAVAIELAQSWVPGRSGSVVDLLADLAGMVAGIAVVRLALGPVRREPRRGGNPADRPEGPPGP